MTSIVDDIYDTYGTLEVLKLFTKAIERFDTCKLNYKPSSFVLYVILK